MAVEAVPLSEVFSEACQLAMALGHTNAHELPGCLEIEVDHQWWFALNAHRTRVACSKNDDVPAMSLYFELNGWPFGVVGALDGRILAGPAANEHTLIDALKTARQRIEGSDGR